MKRIALIDTDGLCYSAACRAELKCRDGDNADIFFEKRTAEESYVELVEEIERIIEAVDASDAILCLTHGQNFRLAILPSYKGNRKDSRRPAQLTALRDMLQERKPFPVLIVKGLEADDVLGISSGSLKLAGKEPIICSPDKDLKTIPGWLYQKDKLRHITRGEADYWHMFQTLTGDTTDGYSGCPGIGEIKAEELLWTARCAKAPLWDFVVWAYENAGLTEEDALTQARVARILRSEDWDADKGEPRQWNPPEQMTTAEPLRSAA